MKASGNLDQRQRLVGTFIARPRFVKSDCCLAILVNGWELNGYLTLASGRPNYEYVSFSSTSNLPQAFTGSLDGLGGDSRVPWLPNNPLKIEPITRFDTRLAKNFQIHEKMSVTLLFEVFKQDAVFPAERGEKNDKVERLPVAYRTALGILGLAAAILHFFLPERPII